MANDRASDPPRKLLTPGRIVLGLVLGGIAVAQIYVGAHLIVSSTPCGSGSKSAAVAVSGWLVLIAGIVAAVSALLLRVGVSAAFVFPGWLIFLIGVGIGVGCLS
jgi:hypothetical protein